MRAIAATGRVAFAVALSVAPAAERTAIVTTPHFVLYSDFETNLNDALIAAGLARKAGKPELFHVGNEAACFAGLSTSARAAWDAAVGYDAEVVSPTDWTAREQNLIRVQLAGFDEELKTADDRQFVEIARGFRMAAAPAYAACRWAAQDEANRRWIAELATQLAAEEAKVGPRLEQLYQQTWNGLPIPVDVVQTVSWSGANSIFRDSGGGHILVSVENPGTAALEVVFHEASHLLMGRGAPVRQALDRAAKTAGFNAPGDLWHVVLFDTTGEAVRRIVEAEGKPGYTPMLYGIFTRGTWVGYREPLEWAWKPYVDGKRSLEEASAKLLEEVRAMERPK